MSFQQTLHKIQVTKLINKLEELEDNTNDFLDENMEAWYNQYVVEEIKRIVRAMNLPQKFIDGVKFVKTGKNEGKVINTWGSMEKPLALWFNDGTADHFIAPLGPWLLHWITELGRHAYSAGHTVSGLPKTQAMEIGIQVGQKALQERARQETNDHLKGVAEE